MAEPVDVVGAHGGEPWGRQARAALAGADVVIGSGRHLASIETGAERLEWGGGFQALVDEVARRQGKGERVCLVASGDPGFFGAADRLGARLGPHSIRVHPAPSSVSLAFARLGVRWDDAVVVSAHGRPLGGAVDAVMAHPKVAVLTSPEQPPEALGRALVVRGCGPRLITVASRIGQPDEEVTHGDVDALASGSYDGLSVVVVRVPAAGGGTGLAWGRPEGDFAHRDGMITKAEVRAVALGKLALPPAGVLWDVGAGSGSVAAECAALAPGLAVFAVERSPAGAARIRDNTAGLGVTVVEAEAPAALGALPDPDRVFVGGGGLAVMDEARRRLRPGGTIVATWASLGRAAAAADRLGNLVQVAVSRGVPAGPGPGFRLAAENPVFITWGGGGAGGGPAGGGGG